MSVAELDPFRGAPVLPTHIRPGRGSLIPGVEDHIPRESTFPNGRDLRSKVTPECTAGQTGPKSALKQKKPTARGKSLATWKKPSLRGVGWGEATSSLNQFLTQYDNHCTEPNEGNWEGPCLRCTVSKTTELWPQGKAGHTAFRENFLIWERLPTP